MRYDLIKADMLVALVKAIHEHKGNNNSVVTGLYAQLGFDCAKKAYDILAKEEPTHET